MRSHLLLATGCMVCTAVCYMYRLYKPRIPMSKVALVVLIIYVACVRDQSGGVLDCGMMSI